MSSPGFSTSNSMPSLLIVEEDAHFAEFLQRRCLDLGLEVRIVVAEGHELRVPANLSVDLVIIGSSHVEPILSEFLKQLDTDDCLAGTPWIVLSELFDLSSIYRASSAPSYVTRRCVGAWWKIAAFIHELVILPRSEPIES